ncbi:phosphonate ABC transporter ATP-binding protein [Natrinema halophilum]|uniref:phosphonate ABC transporter ATP-binding protein n=1 Tax=Natrinema halophilum TaxID=1699371 RepID=UPI001F456575|nr:ATP-binding cassette domain-containing protein [Natrinema halophilum]UHQ96171.1 ATP-binding cassette domain-containing protein [Natrinema halophilum]
MSLLSFENVTKRFEGASAPAVRDLSVSIAADESVAVIGPSGAGKTTLLRLAAGAIQPDVGRVSLDGTHHYDNDDVALVYQADTLIGRRTALENSIVGQIGSCSRLRGLIEPFVPSDTDRAIELLEAAGLGEYVYTRADQLSAGERQRVAVVRAVLQNARVLLADEPTANLDPTTSDTIVDLLHQSSADRALMVVMHDVDLALERFDRILGIADGGLAFDRSAERVDDELLEAIFGDDEGQRTKQEAVRR